MRIYAVADVHGKPARIESIRRVLIEFKVDAFVVAGDITNYFIASKPDNTHLKQMADVVLNNIKENTIKNVYELTGPGVFNQVLDIDKVNTVSYRYTCNQGNFTNDYFQYIDKAEGKWTRAQEVIDIIKK